MRACLDSLIYACTQNAIFCTDPHYKTLLAWHSSNA